MLKMGLLTTPLYSKNQFLFFEQGQQGKFSKKNIQIGLSFIKNTCLFNFNVVFL